MLSNVQNPQLLYLNNRRPIHTGDLVRTNLTTFNAPGNTIKPLCAFIIKGHVSRAQFFGDIEVRLTFSEITSMPQTTMLVTTMQAAALNRQSIFKTQANENGVGAGGILRYFNITDMSPDPVSYISTLNPGLLSILPSRPFNIGVDVTLTNVLDIVTLESLSVMQIFDTNN